MDVITYICHHFQGQRQIEQTVQRVDMDKDIQTLVEENSITAEDHKAEFLMADYFVSQRHTQSSLPDLIKGYILYMNVQSAEQ